MSYRRKPICYNGGEKRTEVQAETINIKIERKDE